MCKHLLSLLSPFVESTQGQLCELVTSSLPQFRAYVLCLLPHKVCVLVRERCLVWVFVSYNKVKVFVEQLGHLDP